MAPQGATGRHARPLKDPEAVERQKELAARAAADLVEDGMRVGLGTGSTVAHFLPALAARGLSGLRCVATSPATEHTARELGLALNDLQDLGELDIAVDGADQIDPDGWLVKGGGGAHTREKIVAACARRFVVIASADKAVAQLSPPVPLELLEFGAEHALTALAPARLRDAPRSPDGGLIADYFGPLGEPAELAARLSCTPGVVDHGLFSPQLVSTILIAGDDGVTIRRGGKPGG
jgi:ribose 5-phosphate isomerase A